MCHDSGEGFPSVALEGVLRRVENLGNPDYEDSDDGRPEIEDSDGEGDEDEEDGGEEGEEDSGGEGEDLA